MTQPARAVVPTPRSGRTRLPRKALDLLLALVAHVAVVAAWAITLIPLMGLASIGRRILMNSQWAFDTGRLLPPWFIAVGVAAVVVSHLFFRWAMKRLGDGTPAYGPLVVALFGVLAGVAWGAYNWAPPVQVGEQVGPASGQSTPWGPLAYAAYYARLALPALVGVVFGLLFFFSRQSPLVVLLEASGRRSRRRHASRARRVATAR